MPSLTFRFTTECELTLNGASYEEAYLKFKELYETSNAIVATPTLKVYPPRAVPFTLKWTNRIPSAKWMASKATSNRIYSPTCQPIGLSA